MAYLRSTIMRKRLKVFARLLCVATLGLVTVTSCGKDDVVGKKLTNLTIQDGDYWEDYHFEYKGDLLSKITHLYSSGDEESLVFTYDGDKVKQSIKYDGDDTTVYDYFYSQGKLSKIFETEKYSNGYIYYKVYVYTYDKNGKVTKCEELGDEGEVECQTKYEWKNGDIVKAVFQDDDKEEVVYRFSHDDGVNPINFNLFGDDIVRLFKNDFFYYACVTNTAHNLTKVQYDISGSVDTYTYTYDGDGYPTTCREGSTTMIYTYSSNDVAMDSKNLILGKWKCVSSVAQEVDPETHEVRTYNDGSVGITMEFFKDGTVRQGMNEATDYSISGNILYVAEGHMKFEIKKLSKKEMTLFLENEEEQGTLTMNFEKQ